MITEFLLTVLLLPLFLIAVVIGLERIEEDLNTITARPHPHRPAVDEPEES